jgi:hypothetical protein
LATDLSREECEEVAALAQYIAAITWYERDYPGRGARFSAAVERALAAIAAGPQTFPKRFACTQWRIERP